MNKPHKQRTWRRRSGRNWVRQLSPKTLASWLPLPRERRQFRTILLVVLLVVGMVGPVAAAPAGSAYSPPTDADTPIVSTRGHFYETWTGGVARNSDVGAVQFETTQNIPGVETGECPAELLIYVHGFGNSQTDAIENFNLANDSLTEEGYEHPVVGFTWDSNTGISDFSDANEIAARNGRKLAQFIKYTKCTCPDTKIRLVSHSLGARVVLNAIQSLHEDDLWNKACVCGGKDARIASVHLLGAAVDNEEVAVGKNYGNGYGYFGKAIEDEVGSFHSYYNYQDDVLSGSYWFGKLLGIHISIDQALGENGAETPSNLRLPNNYKEYDVTARVDDDHSGYAKTRDENGVMDIVKMHIDDQNIREKPDTGHESGLTYDDIPLPMETWEEVCDAVESGPVEVEFDPAELDAEVAGTFEAKPAPVVGEFEPDQVGHLEVEPFPAKLDPVTGHVNPVGGEYVALILMLELGGPVVDAGSDSFPPDMIKGDLVLDDENDVLIPGWITVYDGVVRPEFQPENVSVHDGTPIPLSEVEREMELDGTTEATFVPDDPDYNEVDGVFDPETWRFVPLSVPEDIDPIEGQFRPIEGGGPTPAYELDAILRLPGSAPMDSPSSTALPDTAYEWTFGDGETATGRVVEHAYDDPGMYEVMVKVNLLDLPFTAKPGTKAFTEEWIRRGGSLRGVNDPIDEDLLLRDLEKQIPVYNENVETIPRVFRWMVANERINTEIGRDDGGTLKLAIETNGSASVTEFREGSFERPTQFARLDESTAREIADADDPGSAALEAINDGRITWEGRGGIADRAKITVTKIVIKVYTVVTDFIG